MLNETRPTKMKERAAAFLRHLIMPSLHKDLLAHDPRNSMEVCCE